MVLDRTPFYAEAGGQVGDTGELDRGRHAVPRCATRRSAARRTRTSARSRRAAIRIGEELEAQVDGARRQATALNHTATHLLHAALRKVLGTHVQQKGSLVAPDRLRFDFAHFQPVTPAELREIERLVNAQIRANTAGRDARSWTTTARWPPAPWRCSARSTRRTCACCASATSPWSCAAARTCSAPATSACSRSPSESGVASGVRRIEALTGEAAIDYVEQNDALLQGSRRPGARLARGPAGQGARAARARRQLEREVRTLKDRLASGQGVDLAAGAVDVQGVKVVATKVEGADAGALRTAVDQLKDRLKSAVVVLASVENPAKVVLVAGVTADQTARIKAGELVGAVAAQVGGRGGGRADFAQAGGSKPEALDAALGSVLEFVRARLAPA